MSKSSDEHIEHWYPFMGVATVSVLILMVGMVTGHYRGFYGQTDLAIKLQIVMIFALAGSALLSAWRADHAE